VLSTGAFSSDLVDRPPPFFGVSDSRVARLINLGKSQPAKYLNLSRIIANLSQLNWSIERNSVCCFSTVFTL
jgi:hypothetical protein